MFWMECTSFWFQAITILNGRHWDIIKLGYQKDGLCSKFGIKRVGVAYVLFHFLFGYRFLSIFLKTNFKLFNTLAMLYLLLEALYVVVMHNLLISGVLWLMWWLEILFDVEKQHFFGFLISNVVCRSNFLNGGNFSSTLP